MRVSCPSCAAAYEVPDSRIGSGRKLRCARCQHDWWVEPPAPERPVAESGFARTISQAAPAPAAPGVQVEAPDARAHAAPRPSESPLVVEPPPTPRPAPGRPPLAADMDPLLPLSRAEPEADRSGALVVAWVVSGILMLGFAAALFLYRVQITEAWPPAERFYRMLGLG